VTEPVITARAFFERARAGQLTAVRCGSCGELAMPPKELCPNCHAHAWQPVTLAGDGLEDPGVLLLERRHRSQLLTRWAAS